MPTVSAAVLEIRDDIGRSGFKLLGDECLFGLSHGTGGAYGGVF